MASAIIGCWFDSRDIDSEELAVQCSEFARQLEHVHPLLSEIGLVGNKGGIESMLAAPLVSALSMKEWGAIFDAERRDKGWIDLSFWNRRPIEEEYFRYTAHALDLYNGNGLSVRELPPTLNNEACIEKIVGVEIEVFAAVKAEVFTLAHSESSGWVARHWQLWLRQGEPWPTDPASRFQESQGKWTSAVPRFGGTAYTWPEYAPWDARPVSP